jgi:hypothetical protein
MSWLNALHNNIHVSQFQTQISFFIKIVVFYIEASCILEEVYHHFEGTCCLHLQGRSVTMLLEHILVLRVQEKWLFIIKLATQPHNDHCVVRH